MPVSPTASPPRVRQVADKMAVATTGLVDLALHPSNIKMRLLINLRAVPGLRRGRAGAVGIGRGRQ